MSGRGQPASMHGRPHWPRGGGGPGGGGGGGDKRRGGWVGVTKAAGWVGEGCIEWIHLACGGMKPTQTHGRYIRSHHPLLFPMCPASPPLPRAWAFHFRTGAQLEQGAVPTVPTAQSREPARRRRRRRILLLGVLVILVPQPAGCPPLLGLVRVPVLLDT